jgi:hypothetical protein
MPEEILARNVMPKDISLRSANPSSVNTLTTARNPETKLRYLNLIYDHIEQYFVTPASLKSQKFWLRRRNPLKAMILNDF